MNRTHELLLEIARCPVARHCLNNPTLNHSCASIVRVQQADSFDEQQVPEPWSGHLDRAPLLFLSSNPSLSTEDIFPTATWSDEQMIDYFENRFGGGRQAWIKDGTKALKLDGTYLRATKFWAAVRQRAIELFQREVQPGIDYALTEIVHCKSKAEYGVSEAQDQCVERYLARVLTLSTAAIVVVLGKEAKQAISTNFGVPNNATMYGPVALCGRERILTFLPHTNARENRTFAKSLPEQEVHTMREFLRQRSQS